jgi:iron complex outermembrane receptor protein
MEIFAKSGLAIAVSLACFSALAEQISADDKEVERIVVTGQKIANSSGPLKKACRKPTMDQQMELR